MIFHHITFKFNLSNSPFDNISILQLLVVVDARMHLREVRVFFLLRLPVYGPPHLLQLLGRELPGYGALSQTRLQHRDLPLEFLLRPCVLGPFHGEVVPAGDVLLPEFLVVGDLTPEEGR